LKDYYKILNLTKGANQAEIKSAFKVLALKYHPDRNNGNIYAEENFKHINEAYQVLSNTYKREKYDLVYQYGSRPSSYQSYQTYASPNYQKSGNYRRTKTPNYYRRSAYVIDNNYYREQLYTIGFMLLFFVFESTW